MKSKYSMCFLRVYFNQRICASTQCILFLFFYLGCNNNMDREDPNKLEIKHIVRELTAIEIPEDANNIMFDSFQIMNRIIILRLNIKDNKFSFFLKDNLNCIDPNEYYSDQSIKELMFKTVMLQSELDIS